MLKLSYLCKSYDFEVLQDICLELPDRGFVAIAGESGSGKSTLLKCIGLLEDVTSGEIFFNGENLTALSKGKKDEKRGRIFAYIPQSTSLMEDDTVDKGLSYFSDDCNKRIAVLEKLGIADKKDEIARNLSGGERQRVAIAQALLREAPVLLCDEITANLDPENAEQVHAILKELSKERLVLCVGHNPQTLKKYAYRMITIKEGEIEKDETFLQSDCDSRSSQRLPYAKETSLGAKKFFRIFSRGIKSKVARIVFGALFLFLSMSGLCIGITQPISGSDGLIRKQADLLGVNYISIDEYQEDSSFYYARNSSESFIFIDFEKEKDNFKLIDGHLPSNENEILVTQFMAEFYKSKIGDVLSFNLLESEARDFTISGIIETDMSAYNFEWVVPEKYDYYTLLIAYYVPSGAFDYFEQVFGKSICTKNGYYVTRYYELPIIAGRDINETAVDSEVLISSRYIATMFDCKIELVTSDPQKYFNKINKTVKLNDKNFTIVGMTDSPYNAGYIKKGDLLYLDFLSGYAMPVDEVKTNNFKSLVFSDFIALAMQNDTNVTKIGLPVFAVFAVLAAVVLINLNIYEIDEKKTLLRNMRLSGFSKRSLMAYNLVVDMMLVAIALVLFLIVGLPLISHFQIVEREFDSIYIYALNGWAALIAIIATAAIAVVSYLITLKKFNRETDVCSK